MPRITISYRRDDSGVITGRIFDRLTTHYGRDAIFRDIDNIPPGVDFRQHIAKVLDESDILLAIVGPRWLGARGGQNRLDDEADPVRIEIETGLRKQMPVIPVLVLRGAMPRVAQLPDSVKDFAYRHAVQLDAGQDFDVHSARLIRAMDRILSQKDGIVPIIDADVAEEVAEPGTGFGPVAIEPVAIEDEPTADLPTRPPLNEVAAAIPDTAVSPPPRERRRAGILIGIAAGVVLGALTAAAVAILLNPAAPPDVVALAGAKQAAEARALSAQAELTAAQKQLAAAQSGLVGAQKQVADQDKRLRDLQAGADQAQKDLAAQRDIAAKAQSQIEQLAAQAKAADSQQVRADKAEKELAAQKEAAEKMQAQLDQAAKDLAAQQDAAAKTQIQADVLAAEVKSLRAQLLAPPAAPSPAASPATPSPAEAEAALTTDQKRAVQRALRLVGHYQGEADGGFGPGTQAAIKQFQAFAGDPDTAALTEDERKTLLDMAQRLSALLDQPPQSPQGTAPSAVRGGEARFARAYNFENGKGVKADPAEAAYWYALAAGDGHSKAFTNLGTLLARGGGATKPDPAGAAVLWWAAAARGEAIAMYDLGALYERGIGVAADPDRAKSWYQRAAALNDPDAKAALKRLGA